MNKYLKSLGLTATLIVSSFVQAETIDIGIMYDNTSAAKTGNINTKINQLIV